MRLVKLEPPFVPTAGVAAWGLPQSNGAAAAAAAAEIKVVKV
jgi:hypothetical protein